MIIPDRLCSRRAKIQERCKERRGAFARPGSIVDEEAIWVGVGIDCGEVRFGEFGRTHHDLTAIGTVVNRAARAQAAAGPGEILVIKAVYERTPTELAQSAPQDYSLKGFDEPITLWAA
jgi:class 3 adenylate cyclase